MCLEVGNALYKGMSALVSFKKVQPVKSGAWVKANASTEVSCWDGDDGAECRAARPRQRAVDSQADQVPARVRPTKGLMWATVTFDASGSHVEWRGAGSRWWWWEVVDVVEA